MKTRRLKPIPRFHTEDEEREFWATHSSMDYVDWSKAEFVTLPNLKRPTKTISLRLPESLLDSIRVEANKRDVPYQSLMKIWLAEKIEQLRSARIPKRKRA